MRSEVGWLSVSVALYSGETRQKIKVFSRFLDIAYSGNFRPDGKLLVAGDEKGNVKLFDVETKTMLRQAQPHSAFGCWVGLIVVASTR